jgi:flagellar hook-length control protein FliK
MMTLPAMPLASIQMPVAQPVLDGDAAPASFNAQLLAQIAASAPAQATATSSPVAPPAESGDESLIKTPLIDAGIAPPRSAHREAPAVADTMLLPHGVDIRPRSAPLSKLGVRASFVSKPLRSGRPGAEEELAKTLLAAGPGAGAMTTSPIPPVSVLTPIAESPGGDVRSARQAPLSATVAPALAASAGMHGPADAHPEPQMLPITEALVAAASLAKDGQAFAQLGHSSSKPEVESTAPVVQQNGMIPGLNPHIAPSPFERVPTPFAHGLNPTTPPVPTDIVSIDRQLDLARDGGWLDSLSHDIAVTATEGGRLRFALMPEALGRLDVQIVRDSDGVNIRFETATEDARAIVAQAQPRLVDDIRQQGVRVISTEVSADPDRHAGSDQRKAGPPAIEAFANRPERSPDPLEPTRRRTSRDGRFA